MSRAHRRLFTLSLMLTSATALAAPPMNAGMWEITTRMEMPGMPAQIPPMTMRHCYTAEELAKPGAGVPQSRNDCKVENLNQTAKSTSWRVSCDGPRGKMTGDGNIQFSDGTSYQGTMKMTMEQGPAGPMQMTQTYQGRRVGDCTAK